MTDERREFGEFYPGGGTATVTPRAENVSADVADIKAKLGTVAAAAAALADVDPDAGASVVDVNEQVKGVKRMLEGLA